MRIVGEVEEDEVAAAFLRAELESPRFREDVLAGRRGWRMGGLFHGFPDDIVWFRPALTREEVLAIRSIGWDRWPRLSGDSRIRHLGLSCTATSKCQALGRALYGRGRRQTASAPIPEPLLPELEVFVGESPRIEEWSEF